MGSGAEKMRGNAQQCPFALHCPSLVDASRVSTCAIRAASLATPSPWPQGDPLRPCEAGGVCVQPALSHPSVGVRSTPPLPPSPRSLLLCGRARHDGERQLRVAGQVVARAAQAHWGGGARACVSRDSAEGAGRGGGGASVRAEWRVSVPCAMRHACAPRLISFFLVQPTPREPTTRWAMFWCCAQESSGLATCKRNRASKRG